MHVSTKTFGHAIGLSACFRQWRADSHCNLLHGYALAVHLEFQASALDTRNWVCDFGSLKSFKSWLEDTFDHKLLVAEDDPELLTFRALETRKLAQLRVVPATGCEAFAQQIFEYGERWLVDNGCAPRVQMRLVRVSEHEGNSATYYGVVGNEECLSSGANLSDGRP